MQNLKIHGNLLLAVLSALALAAPLACGDDGSTGVASGGDAGAGGSLERGGGGGSTQGGATQGGEAGAAGGGLGGMAAEGGADMGGAPGDGEAGTMRNGVAGEAGMVGEAGMAGAAAVDEAAQYQMKLDSICTVEATLNCSGTAMPAKDKQACLDSFSGLADFAPNCVPQVTAWVACLVPEPAASYSCSGDMAFPNESICADTTAAVNTCFSQ